MGALATRLVFAPPAWPEVLRAVALLLLLAELTGLLIAIWSGRRPGGALGLTAAALLAGPVVTVVGGLYAAVSRGLGEPFGQWPLLRAGARATFVGVLAAGTILWAPAGAVLAICACGGLWALRSYRRTTSPLRPRAKALLLSLRLLVILLLLFWGMRPVLETEHRKRLESVLLVGVDVSQSMRTYDMTADFEVAADLSDETVSRIDAVRAALRRHDREIRQWVERGDVRFFAFGRAAGEDVPLPEQAGGWGERIPAPDAPVTAIGDSVNEVVARYLRAGRDLGGVLLLTDGANNTSYVATPQRLAEKLSVHGIPLFAAGVGRGAEDPIGAARVLNIAELTVPDEVVETYNKMPIRARVEMLGLTRRDGGEPRRVVIECTVGDEVVKTTDPIEVTTDKQVHEFEYDHVPIDTGTRRVKVAARVVGPPPRGLTGAREASELVHVADRGMRILYIEGKFRYETKYITRALGTAENFTFERRVLLQPLKEGAASDLSEDLDDWLRYHAIILGDVSPERFTPRQIDILARLVDEYGKGFCMIGGARSFEQGLWSRAALAGRMPADPPEDWAWPERSVATMMPVDLSASTGQIDEPIRVLPTPAGLDAELMNVAGEDGGVRAAWEELDTLPGASRLSGVKGGAEVLATTTGEPDGEPLIVRQGYGKGRTLAVAFDTTWRWVLTPKDTAEMQKRFWRQVALYLAAPKGNVWVQTDRPAYDLARLRAEGEPIRISAGVEDASGMPVTDLSPEVTLVHPDGETRQPVQLRRPAGAGREFSGVIGLAGLEATVDRPYVLRISAEVSGETVESEYRFELTDPNRDARDTTADLELLRGLARRTQGQFARLSELDALLRDIRLSTEPRYRTVRERYDIATMPLVSLPGTDRAVRMHWLLVGAMILLLCVEWMIRKRRGLV